MQRANRQWNKRRSSSIFFMLWTALLLFALLIMVAFGLSQRVLLKSTYRETVEETVKTEGKRIYDELTNGFYDLDEFLLYKSLDHDMRCYILDESGEIVYPSVLTKDGAESLVGISEIEVALKNSNTVAFERKDSFVFIGKLFSVGMFSSPSKAYFYAEKSTALSEALQSKINVRTFLIGIFGFVLSFVVAGSISGLMTRPLSEMTEKAKRLASGDFNVDFNGSMYSSEMSALADTLNYASDELSKADKMQKELIANVSHDFKTPLTMIKGYASMIREISGDNKEKRDKHAGIIIEETDRLTSLVEGVLDLSKIRSGIDSVKKQVYNLSEYLHGVLDKFSYLSETESYEFISEIEDGLYTEADPEKIGQVLYNLIGNAVNYTGDDKKVYVCLKKQGNAVYFSVKDTGKGIDKEELSSIWDRYYRSGETHKRPVHGTGLGLSIVKAILIKHSFRYGVESRKNCGTTFFVYFPLRETTKELSKESETSDGNTEN